MNGSVPSSPCLTVCGTRSGLGDVATCLMIMASGAVFQRAGDDRYWNDLMTAVSIMTGEALWRSRKVRYYAGDWDAIQTVMPDFDLVPFSAGQDEPANPFLQTVMRKPLSVTERAIPIGVVSHTYSLASHREVAALCRSGLISTGIDPASLRYEIGLSELGEWMNLRIYLDDSFSFKDAYEKKLDLRLECFNSVDGSSRLVILFGWFRFVCSNGLVIGETKIEIKERHGQSLDITSIPERIRPVLESVKADRARMKQWEVDIVSIENIMTWTDTKLSEAWGKRAAARVFHICESGKDVEIEDFAPGTATQKPVRYLNPVPGSPERSKTKYDVSQALSFVATLRKNAEERVTRQTDIPSLLADLPTGVAVPV
jgi:Domain of unknown function (DUF932)